MRAARGDQRVLSAFVLLPWQRIDSIQLKVFRARTLGWLELAVRRDRQIPLRSQPFRAAPYGYRFEFGLQVAPSTANRNGGNGRQRCS